MYWVRRVDLPKIFSSMKKYKLKKVKNNKIYPQYSNRQMFKWPSLMTWIVSILVMKQKKVPLTQPLRKNKRSMIRLMRSHMLQHMMKLMLLLRKHKEKKKQEMQNKDQQNKKHNLNSTGNNLNQTSRGKDYKKKQLLLRHIDFSKSKRLLMPELNG